MANDWSGSDFQLVANVDDGALLVDSSPVGTNTLTNNNTVTQSVDAKQGDRSGLFDATFNENLSRTDANLSAGFVGKSGTSGLGVTICAWVKLNTAARSGLVSKWTNSNKSYLLMVETGALPEINIGAGNDEWALMEPSTVVVTGRWYHFTATYNDSNKLTTLRIWDDTAGEISHNLSGTASLNMTGAGAPLLLGGFSPSVLAFDGLMDEIVIAPSAHSVVDTDAIRAGTFGAPVTAPEMTMTGNGQAITSGSSSPDPANGTDFEEVVAGEEKKITYTIGNSGDANLTLTDSPAVVITGDTGEFTLDTDAGSPIAPAGDTTFIVSYIPTAAEVNTATISIANNDDDENPYTFDIAGTGISASDTGKLVRPLVRPLVRSLVR